MRRYFLPLSGFVNGLRRRFGMMVSLFRTDIQDTLSREQNTIHNGRTFDESSEHAHYTRRHSIENGIERIVYTPKNRRFDTPIVMMHGMWHGAWCWQYWQETLAEWGWETHAFSLPGHGRSPEQRPVDQCTLDYYTSFLKAEMARFEHPPVLMGHSMGGAISQWYLKYVRDDLPAVVLVASWVSHAAMADGLPCFLRVDPAGMLLVWLDGSATPFIRTPYHAAKKLISDNALLTPEELHAKLGPESALVTIQHNPPFWKPASSVRAPIMYVAGELDTVVSGRGSRHTAQHYGAAFLSIAGAAHNLMMERNYRETAQSIHDWLEQHVH